jgi:hypothetical protein
MIKDYNATFHSPSTTPVTTAGRYAGTVLDLAKAGGNPGPGELIVQVQVNTAFSGGTSVQVSLETHTSNDFSSARTVLAQGAAIADAQLTAGAVLMSIRLPANLLRYVAVVLTGVGTHAAGKVDAFLTPEAQKNDL